MAIEYDGQVLFVQWHTCGKSSYNYMLFSMFSLESCRFPGCKSTALPETGYCAIHHPDPLEYQKNTTEIIRTTRTVKNLSLAGLRLEGEDFSFRHFYACSFMGARIKNTVFRSCIFRMCFFDFAQLDSCDFSAVNIQFCSFAGARMLNASFEKSELIHNNFNGGVFRDCTFNGSNLYNSRFIDAELDHTDFMDCNVKNTFFIGLKQKTVSWKYSNTQEAIWEMENY